MKEKKTKQQLFEENFGKRMGPPPGHKPGDPLPWGWNFEGHLEKPEHLLMEVPLAQAKPPSAEYRRPYSYDVRHMESRLVKYLLEGGKNPVFGGTMPPPASIPAPKTRSVDVFDKAACFARNFVVSLMDFIDHAKEKISESRRRG